LPCCLVAPGLHDVQGRLIASLLEQEGDIEIAGFLKDKQVCIVGLGLMGGSFGMALRRAGAVREVVGVVRRPEAAGEVIALGAVDRATLDGPATVTEADIVVLCTPVRTIIRQIGDLGPYLRPGAVLTDMGSTKRAICRAMEALPDGVQPVGAHPMCGKETAGIAAAQPDLYRGKVWVVSPLPRSSPEAMATVEALGQVVGSRVIRLEPDRHDRLVAAISHLPYLLSCGLVAAADVLAQHDPAVWQVAASGFRDTSRLAASDVSMLLDILLTNREPVLAMVERFQAHLDALADLLRRGDESSLAAELERIQRIRRARYP
jgi:prephenate dehydrogenase